MYRSMCRTNRLSAVWRRLQVWRDKTLHFICSTWSRHYLFSVLFYFTIMHLLIDSSTQNNIYKALKLNTTKEKNNVFTSIVTWIELIRATSRSYVVQHTRGMLFDSDGLDLSQTFIKKKKMEFENSIRKFRIYKIAFDFGHEEKLHYHIGNELFSFVFILLERKFSLLIRFVPSRKEWKTVGQMEMHKFNIDEWKWRWNGKNRNGKKMYVRFSVRCPSKWK